MDNDKIDGEGQVCTGQKSGVGSTAADRTHVATPAVTAPETTETATVAAPASEASSVASTPKTAAVAAPTASEQCISGSTNTAASSTVPDAVEHIHATASKKWIPATAMGTTKWRMTERGDRKI